jgi:hypothetical protein
MAMLTQGTQLWFVNPTSNALVQVPAIRTFNPGGTASDSIELLYLGGHVRNYLKGARTPAVASATIDADSSSGPHIVLHEMSLEDDQNATEWALGFEDGTAEPTVNTDGTLSCPTTRTWFKFNGFVTDFPLDLASNTVVSTALSIQRSGDPEWQKKV